MQITLLSNRIINGTAYAAGTTVTVTDAVGQNIVDSGWATAVGYPSPPLPSGWESPMIADFTPLSVPSATDHPKLIIRVNNELWASNGTRWLPIGGSVVIGRLITPFTTTGASEEIAYQTTIYPWMWAVGDELKYDIHAASEIAGTLANRSFTIRCGGLGTLSDAPIFGPAPFNTSNREARYIAGHKLLTNTVLRNTQSQSSVLIGTSTSPSNTNSVISNIETTRNVITVTATTNNSSEPVTIRSATITLCAG